MYGVKSVVAGKMDDVQVPVYKLNRICDWATNQICSVAKEKLEYIYHSKKAIRIQ